MEQSLFRYILKHSLKGQIVLLVVTGLSMPFVYLSLEVPKIIVNEAIGGQGMPEAWFGFEFDQITYLFTLCFVFLALVLLNGGFKYFLNVYRGVLGERMLRRFRFDLYRRLLRFPLPYFKRVSAGEIIPIVTAETEPLGGFIGEAYSLPAFQGGLLLTYLFFIFNQDLLLGAAATAMYPLQMYIVPKLQRRVNALAKERVLTARQLANRIGDAVSGVGEIHVNDTSHFERAEISARLGRIFDIRYQLYRKKFFIKFLNNFLAQVTPFFFYSAGGYFVIMGELSLGALVAVLAAYKDLASPWNELLKYYQTREDIRVKYAQIIEQFDPGDMLDEALLDELPERVEPLRGPLALSNVSYGEDPVVKVVDGVNLSLRLDEQVLILGDTGSGREALGLLLARLVVPGSGRITVGEHNLAELPEAVVGRRLGYVGQGVHLFPGSVRDALCYSLKHVPRQSAGGGGDARVRQRQLLEAKLSANSVHDPFGDWLDYDAAGVADPHDLDGRMLELLALVGLEDDVYRLGLRSTVDPDRQAGLAAQVLHARAELQARLRDRDLSNLVEPFDAERYTLNATVAENLLFGTPTDAALDLDTLAHHPYLTQTLADAGLLDDLCEVGRKVAETMVDLFADLPPGHEFFEQFSFISAEELPEYQQMLARIAGQGASVVDGDAGARLLSLALKLIPTRHRLDLIDEDLQARILAARRSFRTGLPAELRDRVAFFSAEQYNPASTVLDNILFGKRAYGHLHGQGQLNAVIDEVVDEVGLRELVSRVGLDYEVGIAGGRLSLEQRQRLALARALLKRPDLLIVNDATGALDSARELLLVRAVGEHLRGRGLVWISGRADLAPEFERIVVIDGGRVVEQGSYAELREQTARFENVGATG